MRFIECIPLVCLKERMLLMFKVILIDDFPTGNGGSEAVNRTVARQLGAPIQEAATFSEVEKDVLYILCNTSTMPQEILTKIAEEAKYIILEHDYKFVSSRHPWRYENCIVPEEEKINTDLYKNAQAVYVQTDDHLSVFKANNIEGNFISLNCSIWAQEELDILSELYFGNFLKKSTFCVLESSNWIKNTQGGIAFCRDHKIDFTLIKSDNNYKKFLSEMAQHACLVFIPIARESCCRLLVEARALGMNVITSSNSGAWKSDWFSKSGSELLTYLRNQSETNMELLRGHINED